MNATYAHLSNAQRELLARSEALARDVLHPIARGGAPGRVNRPLIAALSGHGLLPFTALASIANVDVPVALSLMRIAQTFLGFDLATDGRTAERMGIVGLDRKGLLRLVGGPCRGT